MVTYNLTRDPQTGLVYGVASAITTDSECFARIKVRDAATAARRIGVCGPSRTVLVNAVRIERADQWEAVR